MAAAKDYQSYLKNKCIVGYGIVNGIVNALIFMGMHAGDADITFAAGKVVEEIALTGRPAWSHFDLVRGAADQDGFQQGRLPGQFRRLWLAGQAAQKVDSPVDRRWASLPL